MLPEFPLYIFNFFSRYEIFMPAYRLSLFFIPSTENEIGVLFLENDIFVQSFVTYKRH